MVQEKTQRVFEDGLSIVYDGSPRTPLEAEKLIPFLIKLFGKECVVAVELKVGEAELRSRLSKRRVCSLDHSHAFIDSENHHIGDLCPKMDGGVLQKREIDESALFETRMGEFRNLTIPAIEFFHKEDVLIVINGEQSIENVRRDIDEAFAKRFGKRWPRGV